MSSFVDEVDCFYCKNVVKQKNVILIKVVDGDYILNDDDLKQLKLLDLSFEIGEIILVEEYSVQKIIENESIDEEIGNCEVLILIVLEYDFEFKVDMSMFLICEEEDNEEEIEEKDNEFEV